MTRRDLLHAMLLRSDNRAARALARAVSGSYEEFGLAMNKKARELGLAKSLFYEPSGLDPRNVSTAVEVAKIMHHAMSYDAIARITAKRSYEATCFDRKVTRKMSMSNTNRLLWSPYRVLMGKTGYIDASAYCLGAVVANNRGQKLTAVVLGVPGDRLRFREIRNLLEWGYRNVS
jgi:D-alanyl-D-alanine endopeptidase (penicillin-binding protein 7)